MVKSVKCFLIILFLPSLCFAGHLYPEKSYQYSWCNDHGGNLEYRLDDGARVDCLTDEYAVEFDFGSKWAESIGQALYYAQKTGMKPGVVLILERDQDARYLDRLTAVAGSHSIKLWTLTPDSLGAKANPNLP